MATKTFIVLAALAVLAVASASTPITVNAPLGSYQGYTTTKSNQFRGIPYAQGPSGDLRWQPPAALNPFSKPFMATQNGPGCPQDCMLPKLACPPVMSEDCLVMNIFTPLGTTADSKLPVMMFVHGGQFHAGYAGTLLYDAENMVNRTNVIVAVIQYRLGALGFLYTGGDITGNYGLMDQKAALEYLHQNIGAFGGDASQITVFGQSAGAMSIGSMLVSPAFEGLFANALLESEPFGMPFRDAATWKSFADDYSKLAGCASSSDRDTCLMGKDWQDLVASQTKARTDLFGDLSNLFQIFVPWTPTVGTDLLPTDPLAAWRSGDVHDVPVLAGTVENEGVLFVYEAFGKDVSSIEYDILLDLIFGLDQGSMIKDHYEPTSGADNRVEMALVATRSLFRCTTRNATLTTTQIQGRKSPVFSYVFDHVASFAKAFWGANLTFCDDKVCHGGDLPFVFAPNGTEYGIFMTAEEQAMSNSIQDFWTNFAKTGNPGTAAGVTWPEYSVSTKQTVLLQTPAVEVQSEAFDFCAFWDSIGYAWANPSK